jgi:hypothetical protein
MSDAHITGGLTPAEWVNWRHPMNGRDAAVSDESTIQPDIESALTPAEWKAGGNASVSFWDVGGVRKFMAIEGYDEAITDPGDLHMAVALANAALPDGDPRKITRAMVNMIRAAAKRIDSEGFADQLSYYADVLAALLPPE